MQVYGFQAAEEFLIIFIQAIPDNFYIALDLHQRCPPFMENVDQQLPSGFFHRADAVQDFLQVSVSLF